MQYDKIISNDTARFSAKKLKQYCEQSGCAYCIFRDHQADACMLAQAPRNYPEEVEKGGKHYA